MTLHSQGVVDTQKFAQKLAKELPGRVFALSGDLGSGKTTFTQFFLRALGVRGRITSPTFIIIKNYKLRITDYGFKKVYHIDCYRIKSPKELLALDFKEILSDPKNLLIIEWADRIRNLLPTETRWIYSEHGKKESERLIKQTSIK